ncbi:eukaryotic translation initiation factor 2D [Phalaenopsis equestris]|uniref:eukaryotic translation initiation factor 2D n=1 Tax=Phalaenopsis equestris TaxID=78828 RepID=UPI0009E279D5|nr:eukaryotic translation initiation factor 2D [Phalaenopsis equestris]
MFKKPIEAKALQRLSGADRKKLRRTIKERFPLASDADIDTILPLKAEITVAKLPNRVCVYGVEGGLPLLFDVDGRGNDIFPTVYALWMVPELLPAFVLKGGEVSRFVIGGADLMFPGISIPSEGFPSFLAAQPWAVKVPGNAAPIAVGTTMMSSTEALKAGLRGKALRVLHYYRDSLWELAEGCYVPNGGFLEDIVIEDPALNATSHTSDALGNILNDALDTVSDNNMQHLNIPSVHPEEDNDSLHGDSRRDDFGEMAADIIRLNVSESVSAEVQNEVKDHLAQSNEIDSLLDKCLLQAFHMTVKDKDLPLSGSILWSNHVLACRPAGITLDIKRSSHKKLSKWLQSKSSAGLISAKEDKHKKEIIVLSVNRAHPDYISFKPEKRVTDVVDQKADSSAGDTHQSKSQLEVVELYKSSAHVNLIFSSVGADTGKYYTASESSDVVFRYIERENLTNPLNKAMVILDATLCDALFKGSIKKGVMYPTEIQKKELGATFLNRMQAFHRVCRDNEVAIRKGSIRPIQIMAERRQGNKKVTRVSGVEYFLLDAESLASELQKKFACSTSISELPGKKGQYEVLVQGGVIDDLAKHLVDDYGVPKRYIEVLDKTRK